jgi:putative oxidoreductase
MRYLFPIGKILFAYIFIVAAPRHFSHEGIAHAADLGVPLASVLVPIYSAMALLGGISVAFGYRTRWEAWLLAAFLVPFTLLMHAFWKLHDPALVHIQTAMFWKNISMLGAAILITQFGGGALSLDVLTKAKPPNLPDLPRSSS